MAKIQYQNKETLNSQPSIAAKNKVTSDDMNEIKQVVNVNDDNVGDLSNLNTIDKSNMVNAVNEVNSKNIISVYLSANTDVSNNGKVPFDLSTSVGSKLTFDSTNKEIIIGDGVTKVKVDLTLGVRYSATNSQYYGMVLQVNGSEPSTADKVLEARCQKTLGQAITAGSGTKIIPVTSGDKLSCKIISGATCPCTPTTFFNVEVVE